ncbi:aldose 1-epimerase [Yeosuana marina]|uniref:aldose 1-epimerase n=1 Tax=Yeosuana marina TaxID=1565536 RepID=UPI0030ECDFFB
MYTVKHTNDSNKKLNFIEVKNAQKTIYAKIYLNLGGSLQELVLNNHAVIKDLCPLTYDTTYASAILFPFANRIKDGSYEFEGETYQFEINENKLNNALHGLVYNQTFDVINKEVTETSASVKLVYHEKNQSNGFPFTYSIYLEYVFTKDTLDLNVSVKNTDSKTFPFTLGWHPYFLSSDLYTSSVSFDSKEKLKLDQRNITEKIIANEQVEGFKIKDQFLDDCYILDTHTTTFKTPFYAFELKSSEPESFLQLYTPPLANTIAIEPTTGVSDSFNNGIGLKTLQPDDTYNINWNLKIKIITP